MNLIIPYESLRDIFLDIEEDNIAIKYSEMAYINNYRMDADIRPKPGIKFGWRVSFGLGFATIPEYESILHKVKCIESRIKKEVPDSLILMSASRDSDSMPDSPYEFNTHWCLKDDGSSVDDGISSIILDIIFPTTADFILSFMEDRKSKPKAKSKSKKCEWENLDLYDNGDYRKFKEYNELKTKFI